MKSSLSIVVFLVFAITTQSIFSTAASPDENIVKDATGKKVLNKVRYHIGPVNGGRFKLTDTSNNGKVCPFNVVQDPADKVGGEFMFTQVANKKYIGKSYAVSIDSGYPKGACEESTFWTIPDAEANAPSNLITTGGRFDRATTCFQVVDYPKPTNPKVPSYMLQHCPFSCGAGPLTCFNVSIYSEKGVTRLASTGATPFEFVFYKISK